MNRTAYSNVENHLVSRIAGLQKAIGTASDITPSYLDSKRDELLIYSLLFNALKDIKGNDKIDGTPITFCDYCNPDIYQRKALPVKTNVDSMVSAVLARGSENPEIVVYSGIGAIGVEVDRCPKCGLPLVDHI